MKRITETLVKILFLIAALTSVAAVVTICLFMFTGGGAALGKISATDFLFGTEWSPTDNPPSFGILPMILGSIYVTGGAIIIGVPIGILTAVFMAYYCPKRLYTFLKPAVDLLAGIPSIVYGFFGLVILVPFIKSLFGGDGKNIVTASVLLGIMILPTIISVTESTLRSVPQSYYEGAVALGATKERAILKVLFPAASSGIMTAVVLGIGRAIGETMAVIMVAGNQPRMPAGIFKGVRTMTANIVLEMGYAQDLHRQVLIATGVVLFIFILIINLAIQFFNRRNKQ
ncbi:MAG: phosphate ABC transporter permease subunit PstC [Firmicutes bacterium]|nr:phosphate ABC transporter permease subunit PstC [Bacillota bacterium]